MNTSRFTTRFRRLTQFRQGPTAMVITIIMITNTNPGRTSHVILLIRMRIPNITLNNRFNRNPSTITGVLNRHHHIFQYSISLTRAKVKPRFIQQRQTSRIPFRPRRLPIRRRVTLPRYLRRITRTLLPSTFTGLFSSIRKTLHNQDRNII